MVKKFALFALVALITFFGYVATRDGKFRYERSGVINAPAAKIYPYLASFKLGSEWSPYEKADPNMKKTYTGTDGQVGAAMEFASDVGGTGKLDLLNLQPNELVQLKLTMIKPFGAENLIEYSLTPEGAGTRFTWSMSGDGGFPSKLMMVFVDCEKMVAVEMEKGIASLKALIESQK